MLLKVEFKNDIVGCDFRLISNLYDLQALNGLFYVFIETTNLDDYESIADTAELEFKRKYPGERWCSYSWKCYGRVNSTNLSC